MKRFTVLAFVLGASACASVNELRQKHPVATFSSSKGEAEAASCITSAWNDQRIGLESNGAALTREGAKFVIVSPASGYPSEVAEVSSAGGASEISVFAQASLDVGGRVRKRVDAAKSCM
ncbi:hypothetical protein SAMN02800692_1509 [Luteibacter sp. UNC138MFCol5.1]|uniref:hypothetical protein n=1 Tax=Luteibacter sp. UNC138MFCol5.1 TaxID=1502774 RepID=UPI0008B28A01|nr:hypothetical protein [Luteibacter sp. UNC138MFCol5.1]SEO63283.1 hypothetical protein SAMN02800692_1509 [Luteibacter sp. UNC138MFCol5.1]